MQEQFKHCSDEALVRLAQAGDAPASEALIRRYREVLRGKARTYYIMGAEEEDVIQEAMIGLFKAMKAYDPTRNASFRTYAEICMNRQIYDAIKAANRKKHVPLNTSISLSRPMEDTSDHTLEDMLPSLSAGDPEADMVIQEVMTQIRENHMGLFSPMEQKVCQYYMEGKSYREIAEKLGKSPKAVYNAMERNKQKILAFMAGE